MLVLNRKSEQKIRFPELGITVQILQVKGSNVRIGIDAPLQVRVVRDELEGRQGTDPPRAQVFQLPSHLRHEMRNELNALSLALHLFKQQAEAGRSHDAEATFEKLVKYLQRITEHQVLSRPQRPATAAPPLSMLLVEDQANEREMLAGFLKMHGCRVATAADGLEAIEYLETHQPAVVLMDMRMPRCDGPATIQRIRENPDLDHVKIFAISGCTPEESQLQLRDGAVDGWFMKPLNPRSLVEALAAAADLKMTPA